MAEQGVVREQRKGREGSRWVNERPSSDEIAEWWRGVAVVHEGLDAGDYISGVTLVPAKEKTNEVIGFRDNNAPIVQEFEDRIWTPYVKVETRVKYFHDLMAKHVEDWLGVIEPVAPAKSDPSLPPGFFRMAIQTGEGKVVNHICCSMKVTVYDRETVEEKREVSDTRNGLYQIRRVGKTIIDAPPATKMIPVLDRWGADSMSIMKAETGAIGRALGMAGMLVVPGSGVATAEDLQEAQNMSAEPAASREAPEEQPQSPEGKRDLSITEPTREELANHANGLIAQLRGIDEEAYELFRAWANEQGHQGQVSELPVPALKGIIKRVEKSLEDAKTKKG